MYILKNNLQSAILFRGLSIVTSLALVRAGVFNSAIH